MPWVMPTMSRPQQAADALKRLMKIGCSSEGIVFVNGKQHADEYRRLLVLPDMWRVIYHPENIGCLAALNHVFELERDAPFFGFLADDEVLLEESPSNWDERLIKAAGDWKIAHGYEDWNHGRRCQGYPVLGGKLVRAVGYLALPTCFHSFGFDSMWDWLSGPPAFGGGGLHNIVCLPDIKIQHNRAKPDLVIDECYKLVNDTLEKDRKAFWDWIKNDLKPTADRVKKAMQPVIEHIHFKEMDDMKVRAWNDMVVRAWKAKTECDLLS